MSGFRPRFFLPGAALAGYPDDAGLQAPGPEVSLSAEDSHHALRVLRLREGDECEVVVGAAVYAARVIVVGHPVKVRLVRRLEAAEAGAAYRLRIGLVQALTRPAAIDEVLEKGTEVGSSFFVLVRAAGSPRSSEPSAERLERWRRIALEAAKQSKQVEIPGLAFAASLTDAFSHIRADGALPLVLEPTARAGLQDLLPKQGGPGGTVALWVGPEGGWSAAELEWFAVSGIVAARLGRSVLRTETAGPVAVAVARLVLEDW